MLLILYIIAQTVLTTATMVIWWLCYPFIEVHIGGWKSSNFLVVFILSFFLWIIFPIAMLGWAGAEIGKKLFKRIP